jgi:hypothetical protein
MPQEIEQAPIDESEKWVSFLNADFAPQRRIASTGSHRPAGQSISIKHPKNLAWAHSQPDVSLTR